MRIRRVASAIAWWPVIKVASLIADAALGRREDIRSITIIPPRERDAPLWEDDEQEGP